MKWAYHDLVEVTIRDFIKRRLPDAHDWENLPYRITGLDGKEGLVYRVEFDVPTSDEDCWIMFEVAVPELGAEADVFFFQAIRSGIDEHEGETLVCMGLTGDWVVDDEDDDGEW